MLLLVTFTHQILLLRGTYTFGCVIFLLACTVMIRNDKYDTCVQDLYLYKHESLKKKTQFQIKILALLFSDNSCIFLAYKLMFYFRHYEFSYS
jgi:hypothetical protein